MINGNYYDVLEKCMCEEKKISFSLSLSGDRVVEAAVVFCQLLERGGADFVLIKRYAWLELGISMGSWISTKNQTEHRQYNDKTYTIPLDVFSVLQCNKSKCCSVWLCLSNRKEYTMINCCVVQLGYTDKEIFDWLSDTCFCWLFGQIMFVRSLYCYTGIHIPTPNFINFKSCYLSRTSRSCSVAHHRCYRHSLVFCDWLS